MERVRDAVKIYAYRLTAESTTGISESSQSIRALDIARFDLLDAFPVKLANFEGPLDLLLHLIRKNEVNIYDIPIALITQQYLDTIELMQELNLDVAGEFLVMAATLIHIKSQMLLPRPETAAGVEGEEGGSARRAGAPAARAQKFKAAAGLLHEREQLRAAQWQRPDERDCRDCRRRTTSRSSRSISSAC